MHATDDGSNVFSVHQFCERFKFVTIKFSHREPSIAKSILNCADMRICFAFFSNVFFVSSVLVEFLFSFLYLAGYDICKRYGSHVKRLYAFFDMFSSLGQIYKPRIIYLVIFWIFWCALIYKFFRNISSIKTT